MPSVVFDKGSATSLAIEQAAYRLAPSLTVAIDQRASDDCPFVCQLSLKPDSSLDEDEAVSEFRKQVNDYFLREQIAAKTEGVRILLYAQAFSQAAANQ